MLRAEAGIEEGDEEVARITLGELEPTQVQSPAPPIMWDKRQPQAGPTVRKSDPMLDFKEPKPPMSTCRNFVLMDTNLGKRVLMHMLKVYVYCVFILTLRSRITHESASTYFQCGPLVLPEETASRRDSIGIQGIRVRYPSSLRIPWFF
ncbi:hypothetical protein DPMN_185789 [Dreissena polymorpha]|uniref:Uncharacterized protein n=1 Tax=Dreissena polymorpha TaxID=45954 RepID=A0A9D4DNG1_DREPO|nr:hypothetical protein DPMN_185789 [Dreissena polymorpha]